MGMYPNGRAPSPPLVTIFGCTAMPDMARRVYATKRDMKAETGVDIIVNEIYRTFPRQVEEKARWTVLGFPGNAATPGFSVHGDDEIGGVDWACPDWAIPARRNIAQRYGLYHNIANESWHATRLDDGTYPLPTLEEALGNGEPTPITLEMLEEREFMGIKEDLLKAIERSGSRGGSVVYWDKESNKSYSVAPRMIKHHLDAVELNIALRESGQSDELGTGAPELAIGVTTFELVRVFRNNGLSEFGDENKIRNAPPGYLFVPGAKL